MRWKWIAGIGVFLTILLMAVVYIALDSYDYNKLKPRISRMVKVATGRELNLGGQVDLTIGFSPTLIVSEVTLANASWGSQPQMIKVEKLQAQVRLLPLLFRHVQLKQVGLTGVDVLLETDPNGEGNWSLIAAGSSGKSARAVKPAEVDIDNLRLENLHLTFREGKTGSTKRFTIASLDLAKKEAEEELTLDLKADYNGQPVALSGKTGLIRYLFAQQRFPLELSGTFSNAKVEIAGAIDDILYIRGIDLKMHASGTNLGALELDKNIQLPKTSSFDVTAYLRGSKASLVLSEARGNLSASGIDLAFSGKIKDLLSVSGIDLKLKGSGKDLAEVGAIIGKKLPTTDEFAVEARLTGSAKSLSLQQAHGSASQGSLSLTVSGGIEELPALTGINFTVKASGKELAEIGPLVGAELPGLGPFDMSGKISGSAKAIALNEFSAMVDKSDFNGLAKVEVLKRPKITVRLESSVIDFTALMKSLEKDEKKPANKNKQQRRLFSDSPLPFEALKKVDADILMKARNVHAKDARLDFGHLTLKLKDSDFSIDRLEVTYKETKFSGNLHIAPGSPPQVAINFLVQNFNLGDFLKETGKSNQVRAIVDIAAQGKSKGVSVHALMADLNGAFAAVMGQGYLTKYLDLLSMDLSQKVIPIWGSHKKAGEINCAVVQFDIKEGVATSQAFVFDSQIGVLTAEGDINLDTEQVNFLLDPKPKDFSLLSLSTKLRVSGTVMHPKVRPDRLSVLKKGAGLLGGLALGPAGVLAPFVKLGAKKKHPCDTESIGQVSQMTPASQ